MRFLPLFACAGLACAQQYTISTVAGGAPPLTPAAAKNISLGQPQRVITDSSGNIYFTSLNCVFRVDATGTVTLIAGNSRAGYSGDGGPATKAQLNGPTGLTLDSSGNLFIADTGNNRVRKVTPDGIIQTVAGTGDPGVPPILGDFGPATSAFLHAPSGVAVDSFGNLYIADTANNLVRQVGPDGTITSFAGNGNPGYSGDNGAAGGAALHSPEDVAIGPNGTLYIVDAGNSLIRSVSNGIIQTVAGNGGIGFAGDNGLATKASLFEPLSIAVDSAGNLYVAEAGNDRIRKVDAKSGNISTVAGNGTLGFSGDGAAATSANLRLPAGIAVDSKGNLYIADTWNMRVRKIDSSGTISTIAGNGLVSYSGDGGPAVAAQLNGPQGVTVDSNGNLFLADSRNGAVREVTRDGTIFSIGGGGAFAYPQGIAVDAAGSAYVADPQANRVRKIGPDGSVTNFAGNGSPESSGDGGPAANASLNTPISVAADGAGNVYIAEFSGHRIRRVDINGNITTAAGTGVQGYSGDDGPASEANLNSPMGIAADAAGNLYIADTANNRIRKVTAGGTIQTIAGTGIPGFSGDGGSGWAAQINNPSAIAVDSFGSIYFADGTARIRKVFRDGTIITIAGTGAQGYTGDGGPATMARLNGPSALSVDASGNVYVADTGNSAIRLLQPSGSGIALDAVTNGASNLSGAIAPGEVLVLYGSAMGPDQLQTYKLGANGLVPTSLAGTSVLFDGVPAPVLYTSSTQVGVVAPFSLTGSSVQIFVQYQGQTSAAMKLPVAATAPGIFTLDSSGQGQAVAFNQDAQMNGPNHPAARGSQLSLIATGGGQTSPPSTDGLPGTPPLPLLSAPVKVTLGGQPATVNYAGGAPGQVAGLVEITVQVPDSIQPGDAVPVSLQIGDQTAQSGATVAIN